MRLLYAIAVAKIQIKAFHDTQFMLNRRNVKLTVARN